jgi:CubicO group peptidase (beta-lactamase class C family)
MALRTSRSQAAEINGFCDPAFEAVETALRDQLQRTTGGAAVCVYHHGSCVADLWGGNRDAAGNPWLDNTMAPSFSTTKGVSSTLLHILADRDLVDYDQRVAHYWPEFAQAGKQDITVRQVLCHQSGLYHIRQMIDDADRMLDWEHMTRAIEQAKPIHRPGTRTGYHGLTYGFIVGEIIQRVTGKKFADLVRTELAEPLELDGLYIGTPAIELSRAAQLIRPRTPRRSRLLSAARLIDKQLSIVTAVLRHFGIDSHLDSFFDALAPAGMKAFDFNSAETLRASIPAANGLFTARSLATLYAMLAGGGELDGVRLISEQTVAEASMPQPSTGKFAVIPFNMGWRLGYHGVFTNRGFRKPAFGHFGMGGSGAWADPDLNLAVALITNSGGGSTFGDMRIARVGGVALEAAIASLRPG